MLIEALERRRPPEAQGALPPRDYALLLRLAERAQRRGRALNAAYHGAGLRGDRARRRGDFGSRYMI